MTAEVDLRIVCAWCQSVMHEGNPTEPDQVSHGCCCACKAKYFPTLEGSGDSECEFELVDRDHEEGAEPCGYNYRTESIIEREYALHIDHERCVRCGMERTLDAYDCDCEPEDDREFDED